MKAAAASLIVFFLLFGCLGPSLEGMNLSELRSLDIPVKCNVILESNRTTDNGTAYILGKDYLLDFEKRWGQDEVEVYETGQMDFIVDGDELVYYRDNDENVSALMEFVTGCKGYRSEGQEARDFLAGFEPMIELRNCSKGDFDAGLFDIGKEDYCTAEEMEDILVGLGSEGLYSAFENYTKR